MLYVPIPRAGIRSTMRQAPGPRHGDRVVVLASERRGTIVQMHPPAPGETDPIALVRRDDLPADFAPIPYDLHELAVCNVRVAA